MIKTKTVQKINENQPKKWKMVIVIWLAIFPLVNCIFYFFGDLLTSIHFLPLRTLVLTLVLIPIMVYVLIPIITKLLANWLNTLKNYASLR